MKILHVINSLSTGGAEKLVFDLCPLLRERGHEVDVALLRGGASLFRKNLEEKGIRVIDFGAGTSVYSPLNIFRLIPYLRKYDVVHSHLFPAQYWVALAKMFSFSKARLVTTEHSTHNRRRNIACFRFFDRWVYRHYAKIIGISQKTTWALEKYLGVRDRVETVFNGVSVEKFRSAIPDRSLVPATCRTLIVQVAGFREAKDQDCVIRALRDLPESIHAAFVGDGDRKAFCEKLADDLGVRNRTCFLGLRSDIPALLAAADIVVMSSHWEGFGLAAVEGMAAGKPVVASDVPGLAEVVEGAGLLFPQGDEKALAETVSSLLGNKDFYEKTAAACSRRAHDFDLSKMVDAYLKIYEEAKWRK